MLRESHSACGNVVSRDASGHRQTRGQWSFAGWLECLIAPPFNYASDWLTAREYIIVKRLEHMMNKRYINVQYNYYHYTLRSRLKHFQSLKNANKESSLG